MNKKDSKIEFQIERMVSLIDGVFGFALTLLVTDIFLNNLNINNDKQLLKELKLIPQLYVGFIISFCIIGYYWTVHHRIFQYIERYTTNLIWINLIFLLTIVLFPFTSKLVGMFAFNTNMKIPYGIYVLNICFTALMNAILWLYVTNPKRKLLTYNISKERIQVGFYLTLIVPATFIISFLVLYFIDYKTGMLVPILLPFLLKYGAKGLMQKALAKESLE